MLKQRELAFDMAKGIGMLAIIAGHLNVEQMIRVVCVFHVPIFYVISGYFLSTHGAFSNFIKRRWQVLMYPYFFTCALIVGLSVFNSMYFKADIFKVMMLWVKASIYGAGVSVTSPFVMPAIGAIWFLWALFFGGDCSVFD